MIAHLTTTYMLTIPSCSFHLTDLCLIQLSNYLLLLLSFGWLKDEWLVGGWLLDEWLLDGWLLVVDGWLVDEWLLDGWLLDGWP